MERRAREYCAQFEGEKPPHPFTTDGCSMWPDDGWAQCCVEHDFAYWCGVGDLTGGARGLGGLRFPFDVGRVKDDEFAWLVITAVVVPSSRFTRASTSSTTLPVG